MDYMEEYQQAVKQVVQQGYCEGLPERETVIGADDVLNLKIALNSKDVLEFIKQV